MSLIAESAVKLGPFFEVIKKNAVAAGLGAGQVLRQYAMRVLAQVVSEIEELAIPGIDDGKSKKAAAMEVLGKFYDEVLAPLVPVWAKLLPCRKLYMLAMSFAVDAVVAWVNKKFSGSFAAL